MTTNATQMGPKAIEAALLGTLDLTDPDKPLEAASPTHLEVDAPELLKNAKTAIRPSFAEEREKATHLATYLFIYLFLYYLLIILDRL